ncbi:low-density lipoprotein receptor-related protein 6-like [Ptychodera flava]|uniref:low-density lipoprotein receptor-related protein 6-like n=1 Tax=Ptychodera flava TaxID=63121 RepID=UPI00396A270E
MLLVENLVFIFLSLGSSFTTGDGYLIYTDVFSTARDLLSDLNKFDHTGEDIYQRAIAGRSPTHILLHEGSDEMKVTLTYDLDDQLVFWKDAYRKQIRKMSLATSEVTTIYDGVSLSRGGMAVDWVANNLYWTDTDYNWIMMCDYNGTYHHTVVKTGLDEPADVAVDPIHGKLYWADWRGNAGIMSSTLTGENITTVVGGFNDFGSPYGVTIDFQENRLYYTDIYHEAVYSVSLAGDSNAIRTEYENGGLYYPFHMDLDKDYFFISENYYERIIIVPRSDPVVGNAVAILTQWTPLGIAFVNESRQPAHINPCAINNGGCDQLCVSAVDEHQCLCTAGYILKDGVCSKDDHLVPGHRILVADSENICSLPTHISDKSELDSVLSCFVFDAYVNTFDYDYIQDMLYVYHPRDSAIKRTVLRQNSTFETVHANVSSVTGIAVDWVFSNLYWTTTDPDQGGIWVSKLDGSRKVRLLSSVREPLAIVVDPLQEFIFWTSGGEHAAIERASLSGRDRVELATSDVYNPVVMAIDYTRNRLYWADTGPTSGERQSRVESIGIDGSVREELSVVRGKRTFRGLAIIEDILLWSQIEERHLTFYDIEVADRRRTLIHPRYPGYIKLFDDRLQPKFEGIDPCLVKNGTCAQLCIPYQGAADCVCDGSDGGRCDEVERCPLTMVKHGTMNETCRGLVGEKCNVTCDPNFHLTTGEEITCLPGETWDHDLNSLCVLNISLDYFLLAASADGIFYVDMSSPDFPHFKLPLDSIQYGISFDFDPVDKTLYVTDITLKAIIKTSLDGSNAGVFLHSDIDYPDGIAVDKRKRKLYWVDSNEDRVEVIDLDGNNRHPLAVYELAEPRALVLDEREDLVYWTDWGFEGQKIERVNGETNLCSNGDVRQTLVYGNLTHPLGLALERSENRLYWCDATRDFLESSNLDGSDRQQIFEFPDETACYGLALTDEYFYWGDYNSGHLHRLSRSTLVDEIFLEDMVMESVADVKVFRSSGEPLTTPPSNTGRPTTKPPTKATKGKPKTKRGQCHNPQFTHVCSGEPLTTPPSNTGRPTTKPPTKATKDMPEVPPTQKPATATASTALPTDASPGIPGPRAAKHKSNGGVIGGVIAAVLIVLVIIVIAVLFLKRRSGSFAFYAKDDDKAELDQPEPAIKYSTGKDGSVGGLENPLYN